jgi:tetratricopeptide (TPR) repeat protein
MNSCRRLSGALAALVLSCVFGATDLEARDIHYGAVDHPDLIACDRLYWRGETQESTLCYERLLQSRAPLPIRAEAAWALNDLKTANRMFQQVLREQPDDVVSRTRWGDLYADSHNFSEAMNIYREALSTDSSYTFARLGAARVLVGSFDDAANNYLEPLLTDSDVAGGARTGAWLLVARLALENGDREKALAALDEAEGFLTTNDWPLLEIYALRASADLLNNDSDSPWTARSLKYNPSYGSIYSTPAHFYVIMRRYRDAIELYQKAIDIEPGLASAHEDMGVNLLRDNQFSRARRHLEIAHDKDPFSPKAVNTLRLLDSLENFSLIHDPATPGKAGELPITLRLHKEEAAVLASYAIKLTRESIAEFTERYGFELREPVVIEMYPDHEDFAVRTGGMPGLGILGATFGYVVAMDSPSGRSPEEFQWGTTLWHEMAHVFTLEATDHLVPRWFSEGISVFEEWRSGPHRGVRIPISVYLAIKEGRMLPVADLDQGFVRPSYENQVIVSYMQAGLVCRFIDQKFGAEKLTALLYKFADGLKTRDAVEAALGITADEFDREFRTFVESEHGHILDNLDQWHRTQLTMMQRFDTSDWHGAIKAAEQMLDVFPNYTEPDSPYLVIASAYENLGEQESAMAALETFKARGGYEPDALMRLANWMYGKGRIAESIEVLQNVIMVEPLDRTVHGKLGDMLLESGDAAAALREFEVALALEPHDKATAYYRLAQAYYQTGKTDEARDKLLLALDVAPGFRPAQRLLLELTRSATDIH